MKILIVGSGCSAFYLSVLIKRYNKNIDVVFADPNKEAGKKFLVTGNGRCNLANLKITDKSYNNLKIKEIVESFNYKNIVDTLNEIGIETRNINELVYPYSLSAKSYRDLLLNYLKENNCKFYLNNNIDDYKIRNDKIEVKINNKNYIFDKIIIATGGNSQVHINQTNFLDVLKKHNYKIKEFKPGLTPLKVNENVKILENLRVKCLVSLYIDDKLEYIEDGEVLFKKDGLSGIAIFNCSSIIARKDRFKKAIIKLNLVKDISDEEIKNKLIKYNVISKYSCLDGFFDKRLSEYIRNCSGAKNLYKFTKNELEKIAYNMQNLSFTYVNHYSFNESQVSIGGVELSNLNDSLESKIEKNVYFVGEILDADGLCGGYNLMFAFASSYLVAKDVIK